MPNASNKTDRPVQNPKPPPPPPPTVPDPGIQIKDAKDIIRKA